MQTCSPCTNRQQIAFRTPSKPALLGPAGAGKALQVLGGKDVLLPYAASEWDVLLSPPVLGGLVLSPFPGTKAGSASLFDRRGTGGARSSAEVWVSPMEKPSLWVIPAVSSLSIFRFWHAPTPSF